MRLARLYEQLDLFLQVCGSALRVGSIAPRSRFLAERMPAGKGLPSWWNRDRDPDNVHAGGNAHCKRFVFKRDPQMREGFYPGAVCFADAVELMEKPSPRLKGTEAPERS